MDFILASSSPRRKELLNLVGIDPLVICPDIKENLIDGESLKSSWKGSRLRKPGVLTGTPI